jgi:hypothetical protein
MKCAACGNTNKSKWAPILRRVGIRFYVCRVCGTVRVPALQEK